MNGLTVEELRTAIEELPGSAPVIVHLLNRDGDVVSSLDCESVAIENSALCDVDVYLGDPWTARRVVVLKAPRVTR